jgi:hypothetical protein
MEEGEFWFKDAEEPEDNELLDETEPGDAKPVL